MSARFRSIRVRLTLWYLVVLAVILLLFAAGVYVTMRTALREQLDDSIESRALLVQQLITFDADGRPVLPPGADTSAIGIDDEFQRLFDVSGGITFDSSRNFGDVPVETDALEAARAGRMHWSTIGDGKGEARVLTVPIRREGEVAAILQSARASDDTRETLNSLLLILAAGAAGALVFASLGGWWLSSRALSPIDRITRAANAITAQDLSRRLDLDLPDDEVGRLARTFDSMIARLDAAFERQRRFTADASHELRTPLTAIRGQIDVVLDRARGPEEYQRVLSTVNTQVERMTRLSESLLTLARADAGALPLQRERVDAGELARSVADDVRPLADAKGLRVDVEGEGAAEIVADEDLLLQLMLNLTDNAIRYTPEGAVTVGWRGGASTVELFVRDTGPGVPADQQERIFERFHRVDASRSRQDGGSGLGLAICRWIAEAHGGTISLESAPGGSTFTVKLRRS
jgi:heavy metal sensor kinase